MGKLIGYIQEQKGIWVNILNFIIDYLPWFTWVAIPITILILIVKSWLDSSKFQPIAVLATAQNLEPSPQAMEKLSKLVERGEELVTEMRTPDFHTGQLGQDVHRWLDNVEHCVWEIIPEYAGYITADQGDVTKGEKIKYQGWQINNAMLRVSVDRLLMRLREIRSKIQGVDKGGSQTK